MTLVEYIRNERGKTGRVGMSVRKNRLVIGITQQTLTLLGDPEYVILLYDDQNGMIGMRAAREDETHGYKVTRTKTGVITMACKSFIEHTKLRAGEKRDGEYRSGMVQFPRPLRLP